jgi:hypothetical protein
MSSITNVNEGDVLSKAEEGDVDQAIAKSLDQHYSNLEGDALRAAIQKSQADWTPEQKAYFDQCVRAQATAMAEINAQNARIAAEQARRQAKERRIDAQWLLKPEVGSSTSTARPAKIPTSSQKGKGKESGYDSESGDENNPESTSPPESSQDGLQTGVVNTPVAKDSVGSEEDLEDKRRSQGPKTRFGQRRRWAWSKGPSLEEEKVADQDEDEWSRWKAAYDAGVLNPEGREEFAAVNLRRRGLCLGVSSSLMALSWGMLTANPIFAGIGLVGALWGVHKQGQDPIYKRISGWDIIFSPLVIPEYIARTVRRTFMERRFKAKDGSIHREWKWPWFNNVIDNTWIDRTVGVIIIGALLAAYWKYRKYRMNTMKEAPRNERDYRKMIEDIIVSAGAVAAISHFVCGNKQKAKDTAGLFFIAARSIGAVWATVLYIFQQEESDDNHHGVGCACFECIELEKSTSEIHAFFYFFSPDSADGKIRGPVTMLWRLYIAAVYGKRKFAQFASEHRVVTLLIVVLALYIVLWIVKERFYPHMSMSQYLKSFWYEQEKKLAKPVKKVQRKDKEGVIVAEEEEGPRGVLAVIYDYVYGFLVVPVGDVETTEEAAGVEESAVEKHMESVPVKEVHQEPPEEVGWSIADPDEWELEGKARQLKRQKQQQSDADAGRTSRKDRADEFHKAWGIEADKIRARYGALDEKDMHEFLDYAYKKFKRDKAAEYYDPDLKQQDVGRRRRRQGAEGAEEMGEDNCTKVNESLELVEGPVIGRNIIRDDQVRGSLFQVRCINEDGTTVPGFLGCCLGQRALIYRHYLTDHPKCKWEMLIKDMWIPIDTSKLEPSKYEEDILYMPKPAGMMSGGYKVYQNGEVMNATFIGQVVQDGKPSASSCGVQAVVVGKNVEHNAPTTYGSCMSYLIDGQGKIFGLHQKKGDGTKNVAIAVTKELAGEFGTPMRKN